MKIKINTYYRTRDGNLAYVEYYYEASIWKMRGRMIEDGDVIDQTWTEFGGVSGDFLKAEAVAGDVYKELHKEDDDLVEELPKENYPEYYL